MKATTDLLESLKKLALSEQCDYSSIKLQVEERLIQVQGHLFGYDPVSEKQLLLIQDVFLCVDRLASKEKLRNYMLHVTDQAQETSYARIPVLPSKEQSFSLSKQEKMLMWI